jgi:hypothetical protein
LNYFSHYFFDHHPDSSEFNFGLLAPDLLRNYSKDSYNKSKVAHSSSIYNKLTSTPNSSITLLDFFNGMETHLERDKSFHNSVFFESVYQEIHPTIESAFKKASIPRFWFALHILIEMQLDQFLIRSFPEKLNTFYTNLSQLSESTILKILQAVDHQEPTKFIDGFNRFLEVKYLQKYSDHSGIIYGLNRIYQQVGIQKQEWTTQQHDILLPLLFQIAHCIEVHFDTIESL